MTWYDDSPNNWYDKGTMVSFRLPQWKRYNGKRHNYTRHYMRTRHKNVLRYDFMATRPLVNSGRNAMVTVRKHTANYRLVYNTYWNRAKERFYHYEN